MPDAVHQLSQGGPGHLTLRQAGTIPAVSVPAHLARLSTDGGVLAVLAIDHRDSLRVVIDPDQPDEVPSDAIVAFKRDVVEGAASAATGVMLEPEYSIPGLVGALPDDVGFFAALEAQGYGADPYVRVTALLEDWSVEQAVEAGASGVKLLIFYTPDVPEAADQQDELVQRVAREAAAFDVPFLLEPLAYPATPEQAADPALMGAAHTDLVLETAARLTGLGATVLKMQFPAHPDHDPPDEWAAACAELDGMVAEPWAVLSAGVSYDVFKHQVEIASAAGASGFMVGRAAWGELAGRPPAERRVLASGLVRSRISELRSIADTTGRPWHQAPAFSS